MGELASDLLDATRDHLALRFDNVQVDTGDTGQNDRTLAQGEPVLMEGLETVGPVFQAWLSNARRAYAEQLKSARSKSQEHGSREMGELSGAGARGTILDQAKTLKQPFVMPVVERRRSTGVRIGVCPIQCFGMGEKDPLAIVFAGAIGGALAQFRWMTVLSSDTLASSFGPGPDLTMARDRLNLNYIVEGKLFRDETRIRFRLSLIDVDEQALLTTFKADRRVRLADV